MLTSPKRLVLLLTLTGTAAATAIEWSNDFFTLLTDSEGTPLSSGWLGPGDGALLQLGYFDQATEANPFSGNWIVLTFGTIGAKGDRGDGRFVLSRSSENFLPDVPLPAVGTPLAIRFYDAPIGRTARFFNTVSNEQGRWNWRDAFDGTIRMTLRDPGAVWEGDGGKCVSDENMRAGARAFGAHADGNDDDGVRMETTLAVGVI